ncbi:MAG: hypothetical protein ABW072_15500 [Sedimenticola sp.]
MCTISFFVIIFRTSYMSEEEYMPRFI